MKTRNSGTTLIEILVVIVIFLVGILAVIQIFPKGFQLLVSSRNASVSTALARDLVERLQANPDRLPEMILPVTKVGPNYVVATNYNPNSLGVLGDQLDANGILSNGANVLGPWQQFTGANVARRIVGEGGPVPAPRLAGSSNLYYGGVMVLQFGPMAFNGGAAGTFSVYGNDLIGHLRDYDPLESYGDTEYFVASPTTSGITVRVPQGPDVRQYRVSFSAYVNVGGNYVKRDYIELLPVDVAAGVPDANGRYGLVNVSLSALIAPDALVSVDTNTLRVQRNYLQIANGAAFSNEPYEYKLLDNAVGVLLFNPVGASVYVSTPGGRQPLQAKVNYDVYDWRVLKEEFRLAPNGSSGKQIQQYKLAVGGLKVEGEPDVDGLTVSRLVALEELPAAGGTDDSAADEARANNFVVVDMDTGGLIMERAPGDNSPPTAAVTPLVVVDKTAGLVTFRDSDGNAANGTNGKLLLPDKTVVDVQLENRALRVLYRVKKEFAVQVYKAASKYSLSPTSALGAAQYYVGDSGDGGVATRIYFPTMDAGRKVSLGQINYVSGGQLQKLEGQDFVIKFHAGDPLNLPSIDLTEVVPADSFDYSTGAAVASVRGASMSVRVLWNPDAFELTNDPKVNMLRLEKWVQAWKRTTNETYIGQGEAVR